MSSNDRPAIAWVSAKVCADILGLPDQRVKALGTNGTIRMRCVPGTHPRFALADALALLDGSAEAQPSQTPALAG